MVIEYAIKNACVQVLCGCMSVGYIWKARFAFIFAYPGLPGGNIILACRDMEKCEAAAKDIRGETLNPRVRAQHLDLASLKSIREFARKIIKGRQEDTDFSSQGLELQASL